MSSSVTLFSHHFSTLMELMNTKSINLNKSTPKNYNYGQFTTAGVLSDHIKIFTISPEKSIGFAFFYTKNPARPLYSSNSQKRTRR